MIKRQGSYRYTSRHRSLIVVHFKTQDNEGQHILDMVGGRDNGQLTDNQFAFILEDIREEWELTDDDSLVICNIMGL